MHLFDTHTHLDDEQFDADRDGVIDRAAKAGVKSILAVGISAATSHACIRLATQHANVHAAVGIQPNCCAEAGPDDWDRIVRLSHDEHVVALGETGLDRHWDYTPFDMQQDFFDRHLRLARERDLPVVIHTRDCASDTLEMLRAAADRGPLRGVMHAFSADAAVASECVDLGLYISFAGMVTYKKSQELRRVAAAVPDDRLLIETDCPYLSPEPVRGKRPNEPAYLVYTAMRLAEARGVSVESLAEATTANARRLFRLALVADRD